MPAILFSSANTNLAQFFICLFGGICCLIPLGMGSTVDFTKSPLLFTLTSLRFRDSAVFAASVTLPLFFEVTFEIISAIVIRKKTKKSKMVVDAVLLNTRERFLLFCGIVTIPITALLPTNTHHLVNLYMCLRRSRTVFVFGGVVTSLSRYDNNNWSVRKSYFMLIFLICGASSGAFADNYSLLGAPSRTRNVSTFFNACFSAIFVYCNCRWLCSDIPRLCKGFFSISNEEYDTIQNTRGSIRCPYLISPLVYATSTTVVGCLSVAAAMAFGGADNYGADALFLHNLMFIIYLLMIMYISERMLKNEVVRGLHALIESKKMYVRYISHELRTPLNSAFLGLKLACEESKQDEKSLETLLDVQSACKIAVEILNDLLCFDKLESGILELHKHDVEVTPFINDCVNMFVSQAKEAGVSISILSENPSSSSSSSPCYRDKGFEMLPESLIEGDMVCMDKFKMDQVLRNLISNALKFTPRGGSVTVCATFVEGASPPTPIHSMGNRSTSTSTLKELGRVVHSRLLNLFRMSNIPFTSTRGNSSSRGNTYTNWGAHQSQSQSPIAYGFNCTQTEESQHDDREDVEDVESNSNSSISCTQYRALSNADWESIAATSQGRILQEHDNSNSQELHHSRIINGKLRIAVTDTGAGISVANQARLFKEVVQFNPEVLQAGGGSGLGLWITNSIVQMHAGTIKVISKGPGQGTSFIVEIDMQRSSSFVTSTNKQASTTCAGAGVECRVGIRSEDERNTGCKLSGIITSRSSTTTTSTSTSRSLSAEQSTGVNDTGVPLKSAAEAGVGNRMGIEVAFEEEYLRSKRGEGGTYNPSYKQSEGTSTLHPYYKQPLSLSPHAVADLPFSPFSPFAPLGSGQPTASGNGMQVKGTFAFPDTDPVQDPDPDPDPLAYDVLVVDDSGLNRKLLCRVLRASKYTCEEANDGLAAFEKVKAKMNGELGSKLLYDVILIDFVMPVMDGPTATKAIRALGYGGLILGLTGNTLDSDINYFIGCGADAVLAKPFDFSAFRSFMAEHEHDHYHDNSSA